MKFQSMQLNSQQQKAAEYDGGHVLVLAGAGTGKTRTIIARAAHLKLAVGSCHGIITEIRLSNSALRN